MNILNYIYYRTLSHTNSAKKIINRTEDDNKEAEEFTAKKFKNRKGGLRNTPDFYDDLIPCMMGKKPVKPKDGTRKFKGAETIRKMKDEI